MKYDWTFQINICLRTHWNLKLHFWNEFSHEMKQIFYTLHKHYTWVWDMTSVLRGVQELMAMALRKTDMTRPALKRLLVELLVSKSLPGLAWLFCISQVWTSYEHTNGQDNSETFSLNSTWQPIGCSQGCALSQFWCQRWLYTLPHDCASAKSFLTAGLHLWALSCVKAGRWLFYCSELREHAQLSTPGCAVLPVMSPATTEKCHLSQTPKVQVSLLCHCHCLSQPPAFSTVLGLELIADKERTAACQPSGKPVITHYTPLTQDQNETRAPSWTFMLLLLFCLFVCLWFNAYAVNLRAINSFLRKPICTQLQLIRVQRRVHQSWTCCWNRWLCCRHTLLHSCEG